MTSITRTHEERRTAAYAARVVWLDRKAQAVLALAQLQLLKTEAAADRRRQRSRRSKPTKWANKEAIRLLSNQSTASGMSLNHIVSIYGIDPADGRRVSGLHVETNLEVIPLKENLRRGNKVDLAVEAQRVTDRFWKDRFERSMFAKGSAWVHM